jgi:hypothetical protein
MNGILRRTFKFIITVVRGALQYAISWAIAIIVVGSPTLLITGWIKGFDTQTIVSMAISSIGVIIVSIGFLTGLVIGCAVSLPRAIIDLVHGRL